MSDEKRPEPTHPFAKLVSNPKILRAAAGVLFWLGILGVIGGISTGANIGGVRMVAGAAVLLAFGYPLALHAGSLERFGELERRLAELAQKTSARP